MFAAPLKESSEAGGGAEFKDLGAFLVGTRET
jgi:hypothetical protein